MAGWREGRTDGRSDRERVRLETQLTRLPCHALQSLFYSGWRWKGSAILSHQSQAKLSALEGDLHQEGLFFADLQKATLPGP